MIRSVQPPGLMKGCPSPSNQHHEHWALPHRGQKVHEEVRNPPPSGLPHEQLHGAREWGELTLTAASVICTSSSGVSCSAVDEKHLCQWPQPLKATRAAPSFVKHDVGRAALHLLMPISLAMTRLISHRSADAFYWQANVFLFTPGSWSCALPHRC